jgi:hypothetical protein
MMSTSDAALVEGAVKALREDLNGLVHGDPLAANAGAILLPGGAAGFTVSKDIGSPARASDLAWQGAMYTVVLLARCAQCFPAMDRAPLRRARQSLSRHADAIGSEGG